MKAKNNGAGPSRGGQDIPCDTPIKAKDFGHEVPVRQSPAPGPPGRALSEDTKDAIDQAKDLTNDSEVSYSGDSGLSKRPRVGRGGGRGGGLHATMTATANVAAGRNDSLLGGGLVAGGLAAPVLKFANICKNLANTQGSPAWLTRRLRMQLLRNWKPSNRP